MTYNENQLKTLGHSSNYRPDFVLLKNLLCKGSPFKGQFGEDGNKKNPDSRQYIHLAQNLSYLRCYAQASIDSRHKAILRTPGYPLFYSIFEYFGIAPKGVLFTQAVLGACIPVIASLLTYMIVGNILASIITGLLCAFSASGIFMAGEIMVDLVFAFVFIGGFYLLYTGISRYSFKRIVSSGATFGIGALVKPTLIFYPFYSIAICYSLAKGIGINLHRKIILNNN